MCKLTITLVIVFFFTLLWFSSSLADPNELDSVGFSKVHEVMLGGVKLKAYISLKNYYSLRKQNPALAKAILLELVIREPNNLVAQKEIAYLLLSEHDIKGAVPHLEAIEKLDSQDYVIKLQLAFSYSSLGLNQKALDKFKEVSRSLDPKIRLQAEQAIVTLSGTQINPIASASAPTETIISQPVPVVNLDTYYGLRKKDPKAAKATLIELVAREPENRVAQKEMAYLLLGEGDVKGALPHLEAVEKLDPTDYGIKTQLAYSYNKLDMNKKSLDMFAKAAQSPDAKIRSQAKQAMANLIAGEKFAAATATSNQSAPEKIVSLISLDSYYNLRKENPMLAEEILTELVNRQPGNIMAQKEMAYLLLARKDNAGALPHLEAVDDLNPYDYPIKLQLAYTYNALGMNKDAFYKFKEATASNDDKIRLAAKQSMVNLAGVQTEFVPKPYFSDLYTAFENLPRFSDLIFPIIFRFGRNFGSHDEIQFYGILYGNKDTQSTGGQVSQIIANNSQIADLGLRYTPSPKIPFFAYIEYGEAYNLIPSTGIGQTKWQYDLRGGLNYFNDWGAHNEYADTVKFPFKQVGDTYANVSYYSLYGRDWIGQWILREGLRVAEYKNTSVDFYWKVNVLGDTLREFYNNVVEMGPCIAIMPYNLLNIRLRLEFTKGYYIPVNTPPNSSNPYGSTYNSSFVMLETFFKF